LSVRAAVTLPVLILFGWCASFLVPRAGAEIVDRIIAIVGDEIILSSEVDEEVFLAQLQNRLDPADESAVREFREQVLESLIEAKVLYEKARVEGIRATREEIDQRVDDMLANVRSQFPSEQAFLEQLEQENASIDDLRKAYRIRVEQQLIVGKLVERSIMSQVVVDEREIRAYWDTHHDEIPAIPAGLVLRRILIRFGGGEVVDSASVERATIVRRRLESGEDFATLAKVFSEGPAAARGGELGGFHPDDLAPDLATAVAELEVGAISRVVLTDRGAHILRLDGREDDGRVRLSQIVFLRDEEAVRAAARARAEAVSARLRAGESFAEIARTESDDSVTRDQGGFIGQVPVESLGPEYRPVLESMEVGDISEILEDQEGFTIFLLEGREGERLPTYEDVRDRLGVLLEQQKGEERYREYLEKAREEIFVENRMTAEG
jgi:peptidyl-prolyl cis-trans isomerase SurA